MSDKFTARGAYSRERMRAYERIRNVARVVSENMERDGDTFTYTGDALRIEKLRKELDAFDRLMMLDVAQLIMQQEGLTWGESVCKAKKVWPELVGKR